MPTTLETLSTDLAAAVDRAGQSVAAVHARRRIPASGMRWRPAPGPLPKDDGGTGAGGTWRARRDRSTRTEATHGGPAAGRPTG